MRKIRLVADPARANPIGCNQSPDRPKIFACNERDRVAFAAQSAGSPGSMGVSNRIAWKIIIDYMTDVGKIKAPARHVRCDHIAYLSIA